MFSVALSGLSVAQKELAVTSNNLANASTTGFKRSDASFADVFASDPTTISKTQVGLGSRNDAVSRSEGQGAMASTQRVTDLAISGRGYFVIKPTSADASTSGSSVLYTRSGNFGIDRDGFVVNTDGAQLQAYTTPAAAASRTLSSVVVPQAKDKPSVQIQFATSDPLNANFAKPNVGDTVTLYSGTLPVATATLSQTDIANGFVTIPDTNLIPGMPNLTANIAGVAGKTTTATAKVLQEQTAKVGLITQSGATLPVGGVVSLYDGTTKVGTATVKPGDAATGYIIFDNLKLSASGGKNLTASLAMPKTVAAPTLRSTVNVPWDAATAPVVGDVITAYNGTTALGQKTVTADDIANRSVEISTNLLNDRNAVVTAKSSGNAAITYSATTPGYPLQPGIVRASLLNSGVDKPSVGDTLGVFDGTRQVGTVVLTDADIQRGYADVTCPLLGSEGASTLTATVSGKAFALAANTVRLPSITTSLTTAPPNTAVAGETVNIYKGDTLIGSKVLTTADIQAGSVSVSVTPYGTDDPTQLVASIGTTRTEPLANGIPAPAFNATQPSDSPKSVLMNLDTSTANRAKVGDTVSLYKNGAFVGSSVLTTADIINGNVTIKTGLTDPADLALLTSDVRVPSIAAETSLIAMAATVNVTLPGITPKPAVNDVVDIYKDGVVVGTATLKAEDIAKGYVNVVTTLASPLPEDAVTGVFKAVDAPLANATSVTVTNPQLQSLAIDKNGLIAATYSDNTTMTLGFVAIANFASEAGLKAVGNTNFAVTLESGQADITRAGPPSSGTIMSGTLEEANVNITTELTNMLRAQQVYNANARMLQTQVDTISRITDKL